MGINYSAVSLSSQQTDFFFSKKQISFQKINPRLFETLLGFLKSKNKKENKKNNLVQSYSELSFFTTIEIPTKFPEYQKVIACAEKTNKINSSSIIFINKNEIDIFLEKESQLSYYLNSSIDYINSFFADATIEVELVSEPESKEGIYKGLFVSIVTRLDVYDSMKKLEEIEDRFYNEFPETHLFEITLKFK